MKPSSRTIASTKTPLPRPHPVTRTHRFGISLLGLLVITSASCQCNGPQPGPLTQNGTAASGDLVPTSPEAITQNNQGVGLMGRYLYADARKVFQQLVTEYPRWLDAKVNLAIACLNEDQGNQRALPLLAEVLKVDADHVRANYCTGLLLSEVGKDKEALPFLTKTLDLDGNDPHLSYLIGRSTERQPAAGEPAAAAMEWYQKALQLDPYFLTAHYRCFQLLQLAGKAEEAGIHMAKFQQLGESLLSTKYDVKYGQMGPKAMALSVDLSTEPVTPPSGSLFEAPTPLVSDAELYELIDATLPISVTACDVDGNDRVDLFVAGLTKRDTPIHNAVLRQQADGTFQLDAAHPLAMIPNVNAAIWGDLDNDQLTDVYLCRAGANQLWRQVEPNRWEDVTESTNSAAGDGNSVDGAAFDADHDGDLDLWVVNADGPNELLNNNRDGTFTGIASTAGIAGDEASRSLLILDLDTDRDFDLVVLNERPPHQVFLNDLGGKYRPGEMLAEFVSEPITAAVCGDLDADGFSEIYAVVGSSLLSWSRDDAGSWRRTSIRDNLPAANAIQLAVSDMNGDGQSEFIVGGDSWQVWPYENGPGPLFSSEGSDVAGWSTVVLDEGGPAVAAVAQSGIPFLWKPGSARFPFLGLTLKGSTKGGNRERSNTSALGARAELRGGSRWTVAENLRSHSGPGQSLQPIALGLGPSASADFVRITWPDGVTQVELGIAAGSRQIVEEDLLPTSCPVLFVWNGETFEFVSDLLGVGGMGYFVAPGQYASPDPDESFLIPPGVMVPREGLFRLKLAEPMEELTYLDQVALTAYDLPPGWQVTIDERMGIGAPFPTGQPLYYRRALQPIQAWNDRQADVTRTVQRPDHQAAPPGALDRRFVGRLANEHVLTIEFETPIPVDQGQPVLIADGWVEFPFSQTNYAAWQAGATFHAPTLEYLGADGAWQVLHREFGYPAGMPREMSVPLAGLPGGVTQLRLRTNLEIYWDRLAVAITEPCPLVRTHVLQLKRANLGKCGLIPRIVQDQQRPHFDYAQRLPVSITRDPSGYYTAFGNVEQLVAEHDNALVIFGPGEEVDLAFDAPPNPPLAGWTRRLLLKSIGWCKDMDLYTGKGQTVEPVPAAELIGDGDGALHRHYNTRFQHGRTE